MSRYRKFRQVLMLTGIWGVLQSVESGDVYHTNRTFTPVEFNLQGTPTVDQLYSEAMKLTDVVKGTNIVINTNETYAVEKQVAIAVGYDSAEGAWNAAVDYNGTPSNYPGKIFDNVGWVRGTRSYRGEWGAYLWVIQNKITFLSSTSAWWRATTNGVPVAITNVMVGSLGNYAPMSNVVDVGPHLDAATNNYPGDNQSEAKEYRVDITNVFYQLSIPDIWITPRSAVRCVGGSNVQYTVTGTNIPQGVSWTLIPDLSGSGGAAFQSYSAWQSTVTPGSVATNYKVRATSKDNTNFYDQVDLVVRKVDIVETNVYVAISNIVTFHLTPESSMNVQWQIIPSLQNGAFIQGSSVGTSIVINAGSIPTNYAVRAYAADLASCSDTCTVSVIKIEKIPLGGITNLSRNIIGKVYIPTKWGGSHMLYGSNVYIQFFYMNGMDLDMETAIKIAKGELDGNRVAQGDPCLYEVPFGKFGWYYAKITDETEQTVSSTFHEHGEVPRPWQGYFWPTKPDHAGPNLYDDGYALDKYDKVYGTTAKVWEAVNHVDDESWAGHCWGTAVASVLTNQPAATTSTNNVSFGQEDMEGLYIELADSMAVEYDLYSADIPVSPVSTNTGEAIDNYCDDFHNAVVKTLIDRKEPLVGDLRDSSRQDESAVWNHAVYKSSFRMMQAAGQDDEKVILVYTAIHSPVTERYPSSVTEDRVDTYKYEVKYKTNGEIDGTYSNQNWIAASGFPPRFLLRLKSCRWVAQNTEVTLEKVKDLY